MRYIDFARFWSKCNAPIPPKGATSLDGLAARTGIIWVRPVQKTAGEKLTGSGRAPLNSVFGRFVSSQAVQRPATVHLQSKTSTIKYATMYK